MIFAIDLWFKGWGFGFSIAIWEHCEHYLIKLGFNAQVKALGKGKTCDVEWSVEDARA